MFLQAKAECGRKTFLQRLISPQGKGDKISRFSQQQARLIRAITLVGALFVSLGIWSWLDACSLSHPHAHQMVNEEGAVRFATPQDVTLFGAAPPLRQNLPMNIAGELPILSDAGDMVVEEQEDGGVVGYVLPHDSRKAWGEVKDYFRKENWQVQPESELTAGTFTRQQGHCRWVYASCVAVGDETAVVLQYQLAEG